MESPSKTLQSLPVGVEASWTLLKCALKQINTHNDRAYPVCITIHLVQTSNFVSSKWSFFEKKCRANFCITTKYINLLSHSWFAYFFSAFGPFGIPTLTRLYCCCRWLLDRTYVWNVWIVWTRHNSGTLTWMALRVCWIFCQFSRVDNEMHIGGWHRGIDYRLYWGTTNVSDDWMHWSTVCEDWTECIASTEFCP